MTDGLRGAFWGLSVAVTNLWRGLPIPQETHFRLPSRPVRLRPSVRRIPSKFPIARVSVEVPTEQTVLDSFGHPRLLDWARLFGCEIHVPLVFRERDDG
jgi:hypothetical protein